MDIYFSDINRVLNTLSTYIGNLEILFSQDLNIKPTSLAKTKILGYELKELTPLLKVGNISYETKTNLLVALEGFISKLATNLNISFNGISSKVVSLEVWDIHRHHKHTSSNYYSSYLEGIIDTYTTFVSLARLESKHVNVEILSDQIAVSLWWRDQGLAVKPIDITDNNNEQFYIIQHTNIIPIADYLKLNMAFLYLQAAVKWGENRLTCRSHNELFITEIFLWRANADKTIFQSVPFAERKLTLISQHILQIYLPHYIKKSQELEMALKETIDQLSTYPRPNSFSNVDYISQLEKFLEELGNFRESL